MIRHCDAEERVDELRHLNRVEIRARWLVKRDASELGNEWDPTRRT
jgi:hypothetical protein